MDLRRSQREKYLSRTTDFTEARKDQPDQAARERRAPIGLTPVSKSVDLGRRDVISGVKPVEDTVNVEEAGKSVLA